MNDNRNGRKKCLIKLITLKHRVTPAYETHKSKKEKSASPREALMAIWVQAIGNLEEPINIEQLQELYHALALSSTKSELCQLFEMLDSDNDGLICFSDFVQQIPMYADNDAAAVVSDHRKAKASGGGGGGGGGGDNDEDDFLFLPKRDSHSSATKSKKKAVINMDSGEFAFGNEYN